MNKKKILLLISVIVIALALTGCTVPHDASGKTILIDNSTTFKYMFDNEGFFAALLVFPLTKLLNFFANSTGSVFLGIVLVTAIVNIGVVLVTWKQNVAQQKMQELQPEMAKIQKKYEGRTDQDSRLRQGQEMQQLYNKHGVNPLASMATMFIQMPILLSIYHAVMRSYAVHQGKFLNMDLEISPLAGFKTGNYGYLVLLVILLLAQLASMKIPTFLSELKAKKEAEKHYRKYEKVPNKAQNIMYGFTVMILFMALSMPTAMTIYWIVSSTILTLKTYIIHVIMERKANEEISR